MTVKHGRPALYLDELAHSIYVLIVWKFTTPLYNIILVFGMEAVYVRGMYDDDDDRKDRVRPIVFPENTRLYASIFC